MKKINPKKHVLFVINGLGMGNSTRCYSVIQELCRLGFTVDVATSGNGLLFFKGKSEVRQVFSLGSMYYGKGKDNKLNVFKTFLAAVPAVRTFWKNGLELLKISRRTKPAAIVYDSQYNLVPIFFSASQVIALNNADMVFDYFFRLKRKPASIFPQFFCIEMMDYLFHKSFPHHVLSPWVDPKGIPNSRQSLSRINLIVRNGLVASGGREPSVRRVLIMLSGSTFGRTIDPTSWGLPYQFDIVGRDGESTANVRFHGKLVDNIQLLRSADVLVINAGFSAVSEALVLRKPVVVIPVENHAEQYVNAAIVENLGVGVVADYEGAKAALEKIISQFDGYTKRCQSHAIAGTGAHEFAKVVESITSGEPVSVLETEPVK